ncbi:MAG: M20/M25/M40 family metallo-hydrolase [Chloroflexota bacterium]|nr:M20/M25/M40 family metallo-hydrolase [Chloroflexota bacterium]
MTSTTGTLPIYEQPAELLRNLLRFDTTNPPGNERECILYLDGLLRDAGIDTEIAGRDDNRPNLIARLERRGNAPGLLLQGHVDVVNTEGQNWTHPPFSADIADGHIWGRGALDMKGAVAMMVAAVLRAKAEGLEPAGDIVFAALADEERGGDYGAKYLVENHPHLFNGLRYAIGEAGGESLPLGGRVFYPIQVTEKQTCRLKVTLTGPGGHGSVPLRGGAMAKLGRLLTTLDSQRLPVHITPVVNRMLGEMSAALPEPLKGVVGALLDPTTTDSALDGMGELGRILNPMLHNTVSPTIVHGGTEINVIPSELTLMLDGRILPGYTPDDMLAELHSLLGTDLRIEIIRYDSYPPEPDMALYETLAGILREMDPEGIPVPTMLSGVTDGRHFARLGIQPYGFTPMKLPNALELHPTVHAADERVPLGAVEFGAEAMYRLLQRYGR